MNMDKNQAFKLVISIFICFLAGAIGGLATTPAIPTWYAGLAKPAFSPPNWLFGPVWTTLYILMGISLFMIWREGLERPGIKKAISIFSVQLILNAIWSIAFFGLKSPFYGLIIIGALWIAIIATILSFTRISKTAGYILIPYILWVTFAAFLNYNIFILNP